MYSIRRGNKRKILHSSSYFNDMTTKVDTLEQTKWKGKREKWSYKSDTYLLEVLIGEWSCSPVKSIELFIGCESSVTVLVEESWEVVYVTWWSCHLFFNNIECNTRVEHIHYVNTWTIKMLTITLITTDTYADSQYSSQIFNTYIWRQSPS